MPREIELSASERQEIRKRYEQMIPLAQLTEEFGRSRPFLAKAIVAEGGNIRKRGRVPNVSPVRKSAVTSVSLVRKSAVASVSLATQTREKTVYDSAGSSFTIYCHGESGNLLDKHLVLYREISLRGLFAFSVASRFRFSSIEEIESSRERIRIFNDEKSPKELLEMFCFAAFEDSWGALPYEFLRNDIVGAASFNSDLRDYIAEWNENKTKGSMWLRDKLVERDRREPSRTLLDLEPADKAATPKDLVEEMLRDLPKSIWTGGTILDPSCGHGTFLLEAKRIMRECTNLSEEQILQSLYGFEKDPRRAYITAALLDPEGVCDRPNIFLGDFLSREKWMSINTKNCVIIGNFPFQEPTGLKGTATKDLSGQFVEQILDSEEPKLMVVVLPEKLWKNKKVTKKLFANGLRSYKKLGLNAFPGITVRTCWVFCEPGYDGKTLVEDGSGVKVEIEKGEFIPDDLRLAPIFQKLRVSHPKGMGYRYNGIGVGKSGVPSTHVEKLEKVLETCPDSIEVISSPTKPTRRVRKFDLEETAKKAPKFAKGQIDIYAGHKKHKVVFSGGSGGITNLVISDPSQICGWTACWMPTGSKQEAENLKSYLKTKLVKALAPSGWGITISKSVMDKVPDVDLSSPWTNERVYKHFGLTEKEIELIETLGNGS